MAEETAEQKAAREAAASKPQTETEKRISDLEASNKALVKEAMEKKEHIRKLEESRKAEEDKHLKDQNKFKELFEQASPTLERFKKLEPMLNTMLETEVAEIPEDKRELIPQFSTVEEKLLWVRNAKTKGLFVASPALDPKTGKPIVPAKTPASSVQSKTQTSETAQEFLSYGADDARLQKLSLNDYRLWKQHNQKPGVGVKGWGG